MDIAQLDAFVTVAELRHFGRAAERLHLTQPALTKRIQSLEKRIGAPLFRRGRLGVELTGLGEFLLPQASLLVEDAETWLSRARQAVEGRAGTLKIGFGLSALDLAPRLIGRFRESYPDVTVTLNDYTSATQLDLLQAGRLDLGFMRLPNAPSLEVLPLREDHLAIVVPVSMAGAPLDLERLNRLGFILLSPERGSGLTRQVAAWSAAAGFTPRVLQYADDILTMLSLVAAGVGCSIVPHRSAHLLSEGLHFFPLTEPQAQWTIGIAWRKASENPALRSFLAMVETN
jgi:DNA-binding transcriptional LysR family regulator